MVMSLFRSEAVLAQDQEPQLSKNERLYIEMMAQAPESKDQLTDILLDDFLNRNSEMFKQFTDSSSPRQIEAIVAAASGRVSEDQILRMFLELNPQNQLTQAQLITELADRLSEEPELESRLRQRFEEVEKKALALKAERPRFFGRTLQYTIPLVFGTMGIVYNLSSTMPDDHVRHLFAEALLPLKYMLTMFVGLNVFRDIRHLIQVWPRYQDLRQRILGAREQLKLTLSLINGPLAIWRQQNAERLRYLGSQVVRYQARQIREALIKDRLLVLEELSQEKPSLLKSLIQFGESERFQALFKTREAPLPQNFIESSMTAFGDWLQQSHRNHISELQDEVTKAKLNLSTAHYQNLDPFVNDRITVWGQLTAATAYGLYLTIGNQNLPVDSIFSQSLIEWTRTQGDLFLKGSAALVLGTYFFDWTRTSIARHRRPRNLPVAQALERAEALLRVFREDSPAQIRGEAVENTAKQQSKPESAAEVVHRLLTERRSENIVSLPRCSMVHQ